MHRTGQIAFLLMIFWTSNLKENQQKVAVVFHLYLLNCQFEWLSEGSNLFLLLSLTGCLLARSHLLLCNFLQSYSHPFFSPFFSRAAEEMRRHEFQLTINTLTGCSAFSLLLWKDWEFLSQITLHACWHTAEKMNVPGSKVNYLVSGERSLPIAVSAHLTADLIKTMSCLFLLKLTGHEITKRQALRAACKESMYLKCMGNACKQWQTFLQSWYQKQSQF